MAEISPAIFKKIRTIQFYTNRLVEDIFTGAYRSAFKGSGMEFEEVRDYQEGDDFRTIDWNVTARMNKPYVKTFREERELTVMLLVDVSGSSLFGTVSKQKRDMIAEIGAVLAFSAIKSWDKVGLILFTDRIEKFVPPRKGLRHVLRVVRELLAFEPQGKGTDIAGVLTFFGKVCRRSAVCFVLSDFMVDQEYAKPFKIISQKHDLVTIFINDPREKQFPDVNLIRLQDLETGLTQLIDSSNATLRKQFADEALKRREKLKTLSGQVGAGFVELSTDQSYAEVIKQYFKQRGRHRR
jgi:uncharacterized protein (DUF58 family)